MIFILDTNILISALIKDSITRKIIVESDETFLIPELVLEEIRKHEEEILKKSGLSKESYLQILGKLLEHMALMPTEAVKENLEEANAIMADIDEEDVVFIAAALCFEDAAIWSDDTDFEKQPKVKIFKTADMVKIYTNAGMVETDKD